MVPTSSGSVCCSGGGDGVRVAADWSGTYFTHLGWAAAAWIVGTGGWLAYLGPRLLKRAPAT